MRSTLFSTAWLSTARFGTARVSRVRPSTAQYGAARFGAARPRSGLIRPLLLGSALCAFGAGAAAGAGAAGAAVPVAQPDQSRVGITLSHAETAALSDGPVPALVAKVVPMNRMGAGLEPTTALYRDRSGAVHASLRAVIQEAADHPDGTVTVYLNAPGTHGSRWIDVYQRWN
jgi:hypothetical protein